MRLQTEPSISAEILIGDDALPEKTIVSEPSASTSSSSSFLSSPSWPLSALLSDSSNSNTTTLKTSAWVVARPDAEYKIRVHVDATCRVAAVLAEPTLDGQRLLFAYPCSRSGTSWISFWEWEFALCENRDWILIVSPNKLTFRLECHRWISRIGWCHQIRFQIRSAKMYEFLVLDFAGHLLL